MNSNEKNPKQTLGKRKISLTDLAMMALGLFILIRTPWSNMTSFHYLLFFLYIFCIMMRITNLRKQHANEQKQLMTQEAATEDAEPAFPAEDSAPTKQDPLTPIETSSQEADLDR